ncbi:hypothetical protein QJS10_CPB18g01006 [Acorus calamus]|uniref:Uncharacterized protein n=1 Tax=Acorus calamus TaxID=4465 RepID=A0AAV9CS67_ACOCL|nr:hypothetical protein QJS10_CPB18g01006 [Acorus calamus]
MKETGETRRRRSRQWSVEITVRKERKRIRTPHGTLSDKPVGFEVLSRRYALLADDEDVKVLNLEEGGAFTMSSAEDMLAAL